MGKAEEREKADEELIRVLLENKLISQAQANLIRADQANTGMSIDEILIARSWIDSQTIQRLLPSREVEGTSAFEPSESFEENLRKYRQILARILGESSE